MGRLDADIIIIGTGFAGAATAYHLVRRGQATVRLLEREDIPGVHSSGRNAAFIRAHADEAALQPLMSAGADHIRSGVMAPFGQHGSILLQLGDEPAERYCARATGRGRWCPEDGVVDTAALLNSYLAGQIIDYGTAVEQWTRRGDTMVVNTSRGALRCRVVVNAAGPWAGELGGLPLTPMNRHVFVTTPLSWVDPTWPTVWDGTRGMYFRPESGGLLMSACDETPAEPGAYHEDPAVILDLADKVERLQPGLGELAIRQAWVGQRVFAHDRVFVIGFDPRDDHVFHVAGLGGHGVTASYAVGDLAARMLLGQGDVAGADVFSPARLIQK